MPAFAPPITVLPSIQKDIHAQTDEIEVVELHLRFPPTPPLGVVNPDRFKNNGKMLPLHELETASKVRAKPGCRFKQRVSKVGARRAGPVDAPPGHDVGPHPCADQVKRPVDRQRAERAGGGGDRWGRPSDDGRNSRAQA